MADNPHRISLSAAWEPPLDPARPVWVRRFGRPAGLGDQGRGAHPAAGPRVVLVVAGDAVAVVLNGIPLAVEPPASQEHEPPASQEHEPPASQEHEPPASQEQEPPASQEHEPPASQEHEPPASQEHEPPASQEHEPPASQRHDITQLIAARNELRLTSAVVERVVGNPARHGRIDLPEAVGRVWLEIVADGATGSA
jgi:hypothetical protein